jgi:hypothetical protein
MGDIDAALHIEECGGFLSCLASFCLCFEFFYLIHMVLLGGDLLVFLVVF